MKLLYITDGPADEDLQGLIQAQKVDHEISLKTLGDQDWDGLLDAIEGADRVISWQNTEHQ